MGIFTWTDATVKSPKKNKWGDYKRKEVVEYGGYAKLICPDDTEIETECHDSYGRIGGYDIYELVAEWNRPFLSTDNLSKQPDDPTRYGGLWDFEKEDMKQKGRSDDEIDVLDEAKRQEHFGAAVKRWEKMAELINAYKAGASDKELLEKYGSDWKRNLGIAIACDDTNAKKLRYPIKLTKNRNAHGYDRLYISYSTQ